MKLPQVLLMLCLTVGGLTAGGCGRDAPEMVPTRGKVTLDGGEWPKPGTLFFAPQEPAEGFPRRPGVGRFDKDGVFTVTSRDPGDGLVPGTYRVAVECWEVEPSDTRPGKSFTAERYTSPARSGLELTIKPGTRGPVVFEHDVPGSGSDRN